MKKVVLRFAIFMTAVVCIGTPASVLGENKEFCPKLKKVMVNGETLFEAGRQHLKTLEVKESPAKFEYIFVNTGTFASSKPERIYVQFICNGKTVPMGAGFNPSKPTTQWKPGKEVLESPPVMELLKLRGETVDLRIVLNLPFANNNHKRLNLGKIAVSDDLVDTTELRKRKLLDVMFSQTTPAGLDSYLSLFGKAQNGQLPSTYPKTYRCTKFQEGGIPSNLDVIWLRNHNDGSQPREKAFAFIWRDADNLHVCAIMEDTEVKNTARGRHSNPHCKGDVMEFFFQPANRRNYFELHVAPSLATLEMATESVEAWKSWADGDHTKADYNFNSGMVPASGTFTLPANGGGWWGHMTIPLVKLGVTPETLSGSKCLVGRYNYNYKACGKEPEVSTTAQNGLHNPDEWHTIE